MHFDSLRYFFLPSWLRKIFEQRQVSILLHKLLSENHTSISGPLVAMKIFSATETYFFELPRVVAKKFGTLEQNSSTFAKCSFSVENT